MIRALLVATSQKVLIFIFHSFQLIRLYFINSEHVLLSQYSKVHRSEIKLWLFGDVYHRPDNVATMDL